LALAADSVGRPLFNVYAMHFPENMIPPV